MRKALAVVACFTTLASLWLIWMFFVLRHPGYQVHALVASLFVVQSGHALAAVAGWTPPWMRGLLLLGAVAILIAGGVIFVGNMSEGHFEGYAVVIAIALAVQGALTLSVFVPSLVRRTAGR